MGLQRSQIYTLLGFSLFLFIFLSLRTKPQDLLEREKSRSLNIQSTDVNILRQEAASTLSDNAKSRIQILESQMANANATDRQELNRNLSSVWYDAEEIGIAGHYAEQVAISTNDAQAWSIAGTTYALCIKRSKKDKERILCLDKALECIENAISLDPIELSYQINRAVLLADNPPPKNPMRGVKLLLELNKNFPKNVSVINNIARFAIQTNQYNKAEKRLLGAIKLEPDNIATHCLLAKLYKAKGQNDKASLYQQKCK